MLSLLSSTLSKILCLILLSQQQYNNCFVDGQDTSYFTGRFHIVKAGLPRATNIATASLFGGLSNNSIVNIGSYAGPLGFVVNYGGPAFTRVEFIYQGISRFDSLPQYSLSANDGGNYTPVADLRIPGIKNVLVKGYNSTAPYRTAIIRFTITNNPVVVNPAPSARPSKLPSKKPSARPSKLPSKKPSARPSKTPSASPSQLPSAIPGIVPSMPILVTVPVTVPVIAPQPIIPITPSSSCDVPKLLTAWEKYPKKPDSDIAEAQGNMIGTDFVVFGGFDDNFWSTTNKAYYYNTISQIWTRVDDIPTPYNLGITHMATIAVGNKLYGCGGYLGHLGCHALGCDLQASDTCYVYTHLNAPGQQWSTLPPLPGKRAGGGMWYDTVGNSLIFATGISAHKGALDDNDVWELSLGNTAAGWISKADSPYAANHVGSTSVTYGGVQRHYVMGGQNSTDEPNGNTNLLYEYLSATNTWTQKKNMTEAVGHISASTLPYKNCGILIMGGARNGHFHTADIYYYSIVSDTWTKIGALPQALNTPVCSITGDWLYCQSGAAFGEFSWKVMIGSTINPALLPAPSSIPSQMPVPAIAPSSIVPNPPSSSCDVPKLLTTWAEYPQKPDWSVAEAQGNFIGTDFFIFGGFENGWAKSTNKAWYYNTISQIWTRADNIPTPYNLGITHMPTVAVGNKLYGCGGYLGHTQNHSLGYDLQAADTCYVYTHLNAPGQQWSNNTLPPLPGKRAGGGLWYDTDRNSLIFATGSVQKAVLDGNDVWELSLDNTAAGWISKAVSPYTANHVGSASVTYDGVQRHYLMGGQNIEHEGDGNFKFLYEYIAATNTWTRKKDMTLATGHISASTLPYKDCGILVMGGARNCWCQTADIYYYSIRDDTWTKIGELPQALNTPVCSITGDWLYCQSGVPFSKFSWKVRIGSMINPALVPAPSSKPSRKPSTSRMPSKLPSARPSKKPAAPTPPVTVTIPVCPDPIMTGVWESWMPALPDNLKISHGGIINGNDFLVFGGYIGQWWGSVTNKVYAFDLSNTSATWRTMDAMPVSGGITHSSYVIVGNKMYVCGGYLNSDQNIVENKCWLYTHTNAAGSQWSSTAIPSLPQVSAAGALLFNSQRNTLIYTAGAEKHAPGDGSSTFDHDEVYELSLILPSTGWQLKANRLPYKANRVSSVTVNYEGTTERQYVMGGQSGTNSGGGNKNNMYEYVASTDTWIVRSSLSMPRSHFTSATIPYKTCGIIIANGAVNGGLTADISYYSIATNTWSNIGSLSQGMRTTVCDIYNDYLYCQTGLDGTSFSQRMKIGTINQIPS